MARTTLDVGNLCCESEVALIHRRLDGRHGVHDVQVDLIGSKVVVEHADATGSDELCSLLTEAGLDAKVRTGRDRAMAHAAAPLPLPLAAAIALFVASLGVVWLDGFKWAALLAVAFALPPLAKKAWVSVTNRLLDINVLMVVATIGAVLIGEWVEAAAVVTLFGVSEWLEQRSMDRARSAIGEVLALAPPTAELVTGRIVAVEDVRIGTWIAVKPGARVPLDGKVVMGRSAVDESALTGESMPVDKGPGDEVAAGTINQLGFLQVETTAEAGNSTLSRMVRMIEEARAARSPTERFVDRFAKIYTPAVMVLAVLVAIVPPLIVGGWSMWGYRALVLLVVACPCALVISTPVTIVSALARAAKRGVLIKGGVHLEALGRVRTVALDKTGTVTEGRFQVVDCSPVNGFTADEVHTALLAAEAQSSHPLAEALLAHAKPTADGTLPTAAMYETLEGEGIRAEVDGRWVVAGNHRMIDRMGWCDEAHHARYDAWVERGRTVVFVGIDDRLAGMHSLADIPRHGAREAVEGLHAAGVQVAMLTGDNRGTAQAIAREIGLDRFEAELRPEDKVAAIKALPGPVAMVGDGINDAPALAAADVGIAMGVRGTAAAMETADVALMSDELARLPEVIALGRRALWVIRANIAIALALKGLVLLAALGGFATLWMAVVADVGASLLVTAHGLTLLRGGPYRS